MFLKIRKHFRPREMRHDTREGRPAQWSFKPNPVGIHLLCLIRRISFRDGRTWGAFPISPCSGCGLETHAGLPLNRLLVTAEHVSAQTCWREASKRLREGIFPPTVSEGILLWKAEWVRKGRNSCRTSLPLVSGSLSITCDNSPRLTNFAQNPRLLYSSHTEHPQRLAWLHIAAPRRTCQAISRKKYSENSQIVT